MDIAKMIALGMLGGGFKLPYSVDFSTLPDGALPSRLVGSTWSILSGVAINTPTLLDPELLTDPGLEATYTGGLCTSLTKSGTPTVTESADVHGGSKAQDFIGGIAGDGVWQRYAGVVGGWYQYTVFGKRLAGTENRESARLYSANGIGGILPTNSNFATINSAGYAQVKLSLISTDTGYMFGYPAYGITDEVVVDDHSMKLISYPTLFSLTPPSKADAVVKAIPSFANLDTAIFGLVVRADSQANPTNCIFVTCQRYFYLGGTTACMIGVIKKKGTTYSTVLAITVKTIVANAWLEARMIGSTLQIFYNNAQVGTDLTVSDAELVGNRCHGIFSSGGGSIKSFLSVEQLIAQSQQFAGSSFTVGYRALPQAWELLNHPRYAFTFDNQSISGHNTWSNLVRLDAGHDVFIIDTANDDTTKDPAVLEALIRKVWTANPNTRMIIISSPSWAGKDLAVDDNVLHPTNETMLGLVSGIASHYGIAFADYWGWCKAVVPGTYHLSDIVNPDKVHPSATGYAGMAGTVEAFLPTGGTSKPTTLPDRLYDNGDYENTPTRTVGTSYDSISGTWTTSGTQIISSEVDAIVTFSATCQSFGLYRIDATANPTVKVSIDGGAYGSAVAVTQNGTVIAGARAAHTVAIKVVSGTVKIDEFWAV